MSATGGEAVHQNAGFMMPQTTKMKLDHVLGQGAGWAQDFIIQNHIWMWAAGCMKLKCAIHNSSVVPT